MAKINIILWTYQKNHDGTCPLRLRVYKDKRKLISTGYSVREDQWDDKAEKVLGNHPNQKWLNNFLQKMKSDAMDESIQAETKDFQATTKQIVSRIKGKNSDYFAFAKSYLEKFNNAAQIGTYGGHQSALKELKLYVKTDKLSFNEITPTFIREYETYRKTQGNGINTIWNHLKKIRALYNAAVLEGVAEDSKNPFKSVRLTKAKTKKESLTREELIRLKNADVEVFSGLWHARNVFLLQFYIRGVRISDILTMQERHIVDGRYSKQTEKTDESISVVLPQSAIDIISTYRKEKARRKIISPFLLPIVKAGDAMSLYKRIGNATAYVNKELGLLAEKCKINKHISSHCARHTYATFAKNSIGDVHTIKELLGQSSVAVTQAYLADLSSDAMDAANKIVTNI